MIIAYNTFAMEIAYACKLKQREMFFNMQFYDEKENVP